MRISHRVCAGGFSIEFICSLSIRMGEGISIL